ncbi:MAG: calcium/sodium antiporter [Spirochaetes bacterium]|nr:calcium/sodium antiporter [Spirochaetota bacterium]
MDVIFLLSGFILLMLGGDYLVKGSISLAVHLRVSTLVIGVVVVSFGTSAPELVVSLDAALSGHPDIAIGNVVGSNIANIALVLGLTAVFLPVSVKRRAILVDWSVMMFASLLLFAFCWDLTLRLYEGAAFLVILGGYIVRSVSSSRKEHDGVAVGPRYRLMTSILLVAVAGAALVAGSELLIRGASHIAQRLGVDERIISVSIIALGTSLPELATSIAAAVRKELDIFIGNIIGSNIFNILAILGLTSTVTPIGINPMVLRFDLFWMLGMALLLLLFILPLKNGTISRWKGLVFVALYGIYIYLVYTHRMT